MQDPKKVFTQILKELDEKELKSFITKYCKTNTAMQNKFLSHFAHKIDAKPQEKYQMIIDNSIKACSNARSRFFIDPRKTNNGLKPIFKLLKEEQISYHNKPYESFLFVKMLLKDFGELYEFFYDVHDFEKIDNLFYEILELLNSIATSAATPYEFKDEIFEYIINTVQKPYFNSSGDYSEANIDLSLLEIASKITQEHNNKKFIEAIDKKIKIKSDYYQRSFLDLKLRFLKENKLEDTLKETINQNMDKEDVRDILIDKAFESNDIQKAIELIKDSIEIFKKQHKLGIVNKYIQLLLSTYKKYNMKDKYIELLEKLYKEDYDHRYYDLLKEFYTKKEWEKRVEEIISEIKFKKDDYWNTQDNKLALIYKKEDMTDRLFEIIQSSDDKSLLYEYGEICKDQYSKEILEFFKKDIEKSLVYIKTRKEYTKLAHLLDSLAKTYIEGEIFVAKIYKDLKNRFKNKPAFLEELSILDKYTRNDKATHFKTTGKKIQNEQKTLF